MNIRNSTKPAPDDSPGTEPCGQRFVGAEKKVRLDYLAQLLEELRTQALAMQEDTLAYLVEMAMLEAMQLREIEKFQSELKDGTCKIEGE